MNFSDDKLFGDVQKNFNYHDCFKGNSKCCYYIVKQGHMLAEQNQTNSQVEQE